jgi:hypothetical protein
VSPLRDPPQDLREFPKYDLSTTQPLYRIHRVERSPWWFSNSGEMRFDLPAPRGTCYLAEQESGAFIEVFQEWIDSIVPRAEVEARAISTLTVPTSMILADCTGPASLSFGVTGEIHSIADRTRTQAWAAAFDRAEYAGIRYFTRHDPSQQHVAVALFGQDGVASWPAPPPTDIGAAILTSVEETFRIRVRD